MKLSKTKKPLGGIAQNEDALDFSLAELVEQVKLYLKTCPELLYRADIVVNSGYGESKSRRRGYLTRGEKIPFGNVIATTVLREGLAVSEDKECTYNPGERERDTAQRRIDYPDFAAREVYCENDETKLMHVLAMQGEVSGYRVLDYQVPTTNGGKDNIDVVLEKGEEVYITEAKRFGSPESLVRCVLEIQTYYMKLNDTFDIGGCTKKTVKKAVLVDEGSFAFQQVIKEAWAQKVLDEFQITVFILSRGDHAYEIRKYDPKDKQEFLKRAHR